MIRLALGPLTLALFAAPAASQAKSQPFPYVWLDVASSGGSRIALDSISMDRIADSTFFAVTLIAFTDTLEAESGERFDREIDIQELDCGRSRALTHAAMLMAGDSLVATLPQASAWAPVTERALPFLRLRCDFLLGSFLMASPPVARGDEVDHPPTLLNAYAARRALERLYPTFALSGRTEGTIQVSFVIDVQGEPIPGSLRVTTSDITRQAAHDIARRLLPSLRFRPARMGRTPLPVRVELPITFQNSGPMFPDPASGPLGGRPRSWPGEW